MIFTILRWLFSHKKPEAELALERAFEMGEEAYSRGDELENNPFPLGSLLFAAWEEGFEDMLVWNRLGLK